MSSTTHRIILFIVGGVLFFQMGLAHASFDPDLATRSYLDTISSDQKLKSDAYFEGGYWLILWNALYALGVYGVLMVTGLSVKLRTVSEKLIRSKFIHTWIYGALFILTTFALSLPLSIYQGFIREHQYNLANQTFWPWFQEQLISLGISTLLVGFLIALVYTAIRKAPKAWPYLGGGIVVGFMIFIIAIAPVFIDPLFNDYKPLPKSELRDELLSMARANGVPADEVYWFDASKQTTRISANVSGFLGTTRVALNDNLLNGTTPAEIKAVMAHEIGHFVTNLVIAIVLPFGIIATLALALSKYFFSKILSRFGQTWRIDSISDPAGLPVLAGVSIIFMFVMTPVTNTVVRENERLADIYGLNTAREPDGFAKAALRLSTYRKLEPTIWEEFIFYDHPSGLSRISMAMHWKAENLPAEQ